MKTLPVPLLAIALLVIILGFIAEAAHAGAQKTERAMFAAGCFWKTQFVFSKVPGVLSTKVGYSGGTTAKPSYKQVCSNTSGHAETVLVEFDPAKVTFHKLLEVFWSNHDPTTVNRQGPDFGSQYRSVIFYTNPEQRQEALAYKDELNQSHKFANPIATEIVAAGAFYDAEEYHQNYYAKHGAVCF
jgi:peptide-methionine (S)-S-oxide reductase